MADFGALKDARERLQITAAGVLELYLPRNSTLLYIR